MRIVYMGTPDFAVPALDRIVAAGHEVVAAVTKVDARRDRGRKVVFSPVKAKAMELGIPLIQPEKIRGNSDFRSEMERLAPDLTVVAAYGMILPGEILDIPLYGSINIHGSLLPRFRGAAPIQAAILAGDEETGITIMKMDEGLDTGDMLLKRSTPVDGKTCGMLHDELAEMGADMIVEVMEKIDTVSAEPQNDEEATYAPMIKKEDGRADFSLSPEEMERRIRAFDPWPGTFTGMGDKIMKLWRAEALADGCQASNGTIIAASDDGIDVSCGERVLRIKELQMPGRKRVSAAEYLRGNSIEIGSVLG